MAALYLSIRLNSVHVFGSPGYWTNNVGVVIRATVIGGQSHSSLPPSIFSWSPQRVHYSFGLQILSPFVSAGYEKTRKYIQRKISDNHFSYIVRVLTWRAWRRVKFPVAIAKMSWIRVLDMPSCCGRAAPSWVEKKSTWLCFYEVQDWSEL